MELTRFVLPLVSFVIMVCAAFLSSKVLSDESANPLAVLLLVSGVILGFYAQMRPWTAFILFLWLAATIDMAKPLTYSVSSMSTVDVAYILAVPVVLMAALYGRIVLLQWFSSDATISKVRHQNYIPIFLMVALIGVGIVGSDGANFGALSKNYTLLCYVPAAIAIPHLLSSPERWLQCCRHLLWITLVVGVYGIVQAIYGPFDFEMSYMESGLTSTFNLLEDSGRFRAFSMLNTSSTFAGMMVIGTLYAFYPLCLRQGRITVANRATVALIVFCLVTCSLATQRGAFLCGAITFVLLPLFSRPKALQICIAVAAGMFVLLVVNIEEVWQFIQHLDRDLEPYRVNSFLVNNTSLLTFGARVDSFRMLHDATTWTPFGSSGHIEILSGHDLVTTIVLWIGWVGLLVFLGMVSILITVASRLMRSLYARPTAYLWAQVNLAVFMYILIWSLLLGSAIHVSPMNFFFWFSVGNLLYLYHHQSDRAVAQADASAVDLSSSHPVSAILAVNRVRPGLAR